MADKKVSVVVPIYNVEDYLDKCVETIVNQTYKNLEIILVDDGAKDNSGPLCDKWAAKDSRIKVVHKENGGLSSARNTGMEVATGDYIMFEDSDDWLELELIEKCVDRITKDNSELVIFGYKKVNEQGANLGEFTFGNDTINRDKLAGQLFQRIVEMSFGYAWNKLYDFNVMKKSGLKNDRSIIDREDLVFNMQMLMHWNKISYLEFAGCNYLQRTTSLLHNSNLARLKNIKPFCEKMYNIKFRNSESGRKVYNMNVLHYLSDCIIKNILWNDELGKTEKMSWIKDIIKDCPHKEMLFDDGDNPRHLRSLYKTISTGNPKYFYRYVWLSDFKKRIRAR